VYTTDEYNYELPVELIAQAPLSSRDASRLMALDRKSQVISHYHFADITQLLRPSDLLVVNDTRVVPARLKGKKETGGSVEILLLSYPEQDSDAPDGGTFRCACLVKASKPSRPGAKLEFHRDLHAVVLGGANGVYDLGFQFRGDFDTLIETIGQVPLPPYISRDDSGLAPCDDRVRYQTVYAKSRGAVAAPTAGLHFSNELLQAIEKIGVEIVPITLHVGYGTFLPIRVMDIREHRIHPEAYALSRTAETAINQAKDEGRRVIAVGTTTVRVLEYASTESGHVKAGSGLCDLFIYPSFRFRIIDALITNFHLPRSTLVMLVSAFAGRDFILHAYQQAISRRYRFYSYGDAMFIF
jgi:S-adenosylmethionine:tRNA ribosyltransferase-isomerase